MRRDYGPARAAKNIAKQTLNRPPWGRGIGIGCLGETWLDTGGGACVPAVRVGVQRPEHVAIARELLGDSILGVPVVVEVVGDIYPQRRAPTSPPPFGSTEGSTGGSYDYWWWTFGRPSGTPYRPA